MNTPALKERYLTDEQGARVAVVLDLGEYESLLEEVEELRERAEMLTYDPDRDPDKGLQLRADLRARLEQERADYDAGRLRGKPLEQVERELGLE
jgi:hypothetical protein